MTSRGVARDRFVRLSLKPETAYALDALSRNGELEGRRDELLTEMMAKVNLAIAAGLFTVEL